MSKEWFSAAGFERFHQLISAINSVIIHDKLRVAGIDDSGRNDEFKNSQKYLLDFLEQFNPIVQEVEKDGNWVPVGTDPRLDNLARNLTDLTRRRPRKLTLVYASLVELKELLKKDDVKDVEKTVTYLKDLRSLLEQLAHADIVSILGEL